MTTTGLVLLSVLAVVKDTTYSSPKSFLHQHHMTIEEVCSRYKATDCVLKKVKGGTMDDLGFVVETNTVKWELYGKKIEGKK